jgi:hypothetical protein
MIYPWLILLHGNLRWPVLVVGMIAVIRAWQGSRRRQWTRFDEGLGATFIGLLDLQFLLGMTLYAVSPLRIAAYADPRAALDNEMGFFAFLHPLLMVAAVIIAHVGKALAKRADAPFQKQSHLLGYFLATLILMTLAVPWWRPFVRL